MIDSIINCKKITKADCLIMSASYDKTSSQGKGAARGCYEIIKCLHNDVEFFDKHLRTEPGYDYKIAQLDMKITNVLTPKKMVERVENLYKKYFNKNKLLILLGGDHSVSIGVFNAIAKIKDPKNISIIQIDAHCDLRNDDSNANPYTKKPSKFAHSCVMRRAFEKGFNLVQIGIRSYCKEEHEFLIKNHKKIVVFEWGIEKKFSIKNIVDSIKTKDVYLTLDVDGLDPSITPATGAPVPGGINWDYIVNLILAILKNKRLIGADIVEVAPRKGEVLTQFSAAQLCYEIIGHALIKQ